MKTLLAAIGIVLLCGILLVYWTQTSIDVPGKHDATFKLESLRLPSGAVITERSATGTALETLVFTSEEPFENGLDQLELQLIDLGFAKEERSEFGALYTKEGITELAVFPELDKPNSVVLMLINFTPEEAKEAARFRRATKEDEVRADLRNHIRKVALAQYEFSKKVGRFGTLQELCNSQAGYIARLPKKFESGKLPDGTAITITLAKGSFKAKAVRGEFSCWIDEMGRMEQSP